MIEVSANKTIYKVEGKVMGEVIYPSINDNTVNINHTFVDPSLRGQGIAGKLMTEVFKYLRKNNKKVIYFKCYEIWHIIIILESFSSLC